MAGKIETLLDFKEAVQATFDCNEGTLRKYGKFSSAQLKAYLIESNCKDIAENKNPFGEWASLGEKGWWVNRSSDELIDNSFILNSSDDRVWKLFSLADATASDAIIHDWVGKSPNLDFCWLTREMLHHWKKADNWQEMGIGIRFDDELAPEEQRGHFSLKVWHGANNFMPQIEEFIQKASDTFTINSMRYAKGGSQGMVSEWYNHGKITINRGSDVDEAMACIFEMGFLYKDALSTATRIRDSKVTSFELDFSRTEIDFNRFSEVVAKGTGDMRLWLVETERESDFRRYSGVDLHTWDRVMLSLGQGYAYLTIPNKGCVNAAPRLATLQGEGISGRASIYIDGVEIFV